MFTAFAWCVRWAVPSQLFVPSPPRETTKCTLPLIRQTPESSIPLVHASLSIFPLSLHCIHFISLFSSPHTVFPSFSQIHKATSSASILLQLSGPQPELAGGLGTVVSSTFIGFLILLLQCGLHKNNTLLLPQPLDLDITSEHRKKKKGA